MNFEFWISGELSKLGHHFSNNLKKNHIYQKMSITKNVPLTWFFLMKKELRKIQMIFDIENSLRKSNYGAF